MVDSAGSDSGSDPAAGMVLIAAPGLQDPNFVRTLILLLEVNDQGCLGVVLNRPSAVRVGDVLADWADQVAPPAVLYAGGPVEPDGVLAVAHLIDDALQPAGWRPMFGQVGLVDLDGSPSTGLAELRLYAGYAGWGPGQLQAEVAEGGWFVVPLERGDLGSYDGEQLWRTVTRRQPGPLSMLVTMPVDPSDN